MNEEGNDNTYLINNSKTSNRKRVHRKKSTSVEKLRRQSGSPPMPAAAPLQLDIDVSAHNQDHPRVNGSLKSENLQKQIKNKNETPTKNDTESSTCNVCCRSDAICVNMQQSHNTVLAVSEITRLPSWNIREIVSSICSRCLLYVTAVTDSSSKLRLRCEQAMHSQALVLAPPTPDTSPNNFLQLSTSLLDDAPTGHLNEVLQQRNCYTPGYCDGAANDLVLPPVSPPTPNRMFDTIPHSPASSNAGNNNSMLKIQYERPVSPLNTESGGGGKNNKRSYQRLQVVPVQMVCPHCNTSYQRKNYYKKHMRRCAAKYRYAKSLVATRSESRLNFDTISVLSEGGETRYSVQPLRTYRCNQCTVTVENLRKLRLHKRIHLPRFYCNICSSEFTSQNEYEFHRVECAAKMEVFEKGLENLRNDVNSPVTIPVRRRTRLYSRAQSLAASAANLRTESNKNNSLKTPAKRSRIQVENDKSSISNVVKNTKSLNNENERDKKINSTKKYNMDADEDDNDEDNDNETDHNEGDESTEESDDDDTSQVDTLYSKRLSLTNHWVEEHSISSHSHLSQGDNYVEDYVEDIPFRSLKEYDLYLLDRLKIEVRQNSLTCFMPGCRFISDNLNDVMVHDYMDHLKKPRFYCHKCGYCFTSKVFLDYHLDLQNKGRYVCYKCGSHFEYQHQLDRHLIQHERIASDTGEKYVCKYCNFAFLDEDKLIKHCYEEQHMADKEKPTIKINPEMTITNKVPDTQENSDRESLKKKYEVKILNMVLKPMPSKRCTPMEKYRFHLPARLRIQKRIGEVEFRHPLNPNCVGCL